MISNCKYFQVTLFYNAVLTAPRYHPREYDSDDGPLEPISGAASALLGTIGGIMMGFADVPVEIFKALKVNSPQSSGSGVEGSRASESHTPTSSSSTPNLKPRSSTDIQTDIINQFSTSLDDSTASLTGVSLTDTESSMRGRDPLPSTMQGLPMPVASDRTLSSKATGMTRVNHESSMSLALRGKLSRSNSRSRFRSRSPFRLQADGQDGIAG